jgi:hypothetical protein
MVFGESIAPKNRQTNGHLAALVQKADRGGEVSKNQTGKGNCLKGAMEKGIFGNQKAPENTASGARF